MAKVKCQIAVSADGFVAGPNQSEEHGLGEGGEQLHEWILKLASWRRMHGREGGEVNASDLVFAEAVADTGAVVMGRNMFGPVRGPWGDDPWRGWWGDEPPFHVPVFVLTHYEREPLSLGETTFHFVTEGPERAIALAREAAGENDVSVGGGAETIQQCLHAGLLDELLFNQVPVLLGDGTRLFDNLAGADVTLEQTRVVEAPEVAHIFYAVS
jgi:dihydrofolate reductase